MSMLTRYKRPGGFVQLLKLIEGFSSQKRDKFLEMIEQESPAWAEALKSKVLTMEKFLGWSDQVIGEVVARLHELTIGTALHGLTEEQREILLKMMSHSQKRRIHDIYSSSSPSPAEIATMFQKILEEVREMITHGYLKFEKFAPEMVVEGEIEEKLETGGAVAHAAANSEITSEEQEAAGDGNEMAGEVIRLKRQIQLINKENLKLKSDLEVTRERLEKIKKLAG